MTNDLAMDEIDIQCRILSLPEEIIVYHIIPLLPMPDICAMRGVCKKWFDLVNIHFAQLKVLDLTPWDFLITPEFLHCILSHAMALRELRLDNCWKAVVRETMDVAADKCREVRCASFSKCGKLTEDSVIQLAESWKHLEELDLSSCYQIMDRTLCGLAENACSLRELCVGSVYGVTDFGVSQLAYKCHTLELLDVSYCHRVSNKGLQPFVMETGEKRTSLKNLRIKACHKVNDVMIGRLLDCGIQVNNMF
ncbi:F-box/LRR-repeat protein 4-like [Lytechinus variegatus]|uniref:F-box/LRR-repeat protein 4-like n=1 Tax=Lytechinus variegatus TaxID=7654 RepID=UPI001BB214E8|nr:F-box/LRR-repeat protein 4-like [Lytechinus variegatus]